MRDWVLYIALIFCGSVVQAQVKKLPKEPPISHENAFGFLKSTDGYGLSYHKLKYKLESDPLVRAGLLIEFCEKKAMNEIREFSEINVISTDDIRLKYVYGKVNNFYQLKTAYRYTRVIGKPIDEKFIGISWFGDGGLSMGIFKPYYLKLLRNGIVVDLAYSDSTENIWLDRNFIAGASGFRYGFREMKMAPGALLRSGLMFEYSPSKYYGLLIEVAGELGAFAGMQNILLTSKYSAVRPSLVISGKLINRKAKEPKDK
jgi:hypothetical protein